MERNNNQKITSQTFFSYDRNSLCRIKRNGHGSTVLDPDPCRALNLGLGVQCGDLKFWTHLLSSMKSRFRGKYL